jgi:hypothetical protein
MIIIKNDRYYNADTLEPVEIKGTIKNIGSLSIDGTGEWQGSYTLYQYEPTPYANYIMITTITATLLAQIITIGKTVKPTKPVNN